MAAKKPVTKKKGTEYKVVEKVLTNDPFYIDRVEALKVKVEQINEEQRSANGRKSALKQIVPRLDVLAEALGDGLSLSEACKVAGLAYRTFLRYKANHKELDELVDYLMLDNTAMVEESLYRKATGYTYYEETFENKGEDGELILTKRIKKHMPPDVSAIVFYLINKDSEHWKDKHFYNMQGTMDTNDVDLSGFNNNELRGILDEAKKAREESKDGQKIIGVRKSSEEVANRTQLEGVLDTGQSELD